MSGISGTIMAQSAVTRWYSICALNFIESKYTEKDNWKYKDDKDGNNYHLSEAYWGENGYKSCKLTIEERFYGYDKIAEAFRTFCIDIQSAINERKEEEQKKFSWFDPKQETCHLFGIIFYVILNGIKNKNIFLCNNVYEIEGDSFDIEKSIVEVFKEKAETMLNDIFKENECKFIFEVNTIQDILKNGFKDLDFRRAKLFAMDRVNLVEYMNNNYKPYKRGTSK